MIRRDSSRALASECLKTDEVTTELCTGKFACSSPRVQSVEGARIVCKMPISWLAFSQAIALRRVGRLFARFGPGQRPIAGSSFVARHRAKKGRFLTTCMKSSGRLRRGINAYTEVMILPGGCRSYCGSQKSLESGPRLIERARCLCSLRACFECGHFLFLRPVWKGLCLIAFVKKERSFTAKKKGWGRRPCWKWEPWTMVSSMAFPALNSHAMFADTEKAEKTGWKTWII